MKRCRRCFSEKVLDQFRPVKARTRDGRSPWCNGCHHEVVSAHRNPLGSAYLFVHEAGVRLLRRVVVTRPDLRAYTDALKLDPCAYCGGPGGERDHIVPRALVGGRSGSQVATAQAENLTGACTGCNQAKGATPVLLFLLDR